ncbi:TDRKH isoform 15 [Pongo abelii]|uniref:TDRKH isoform 15 n=1 Tax=Pongo abelii TaxID=9601 RepID=A0A2J8VFB2_PONAB|nr:TDRKH isoform 15 [Pongo abelii]
MSTERTSWTSLSTIQKIALGLGIPASATIAYILYRRYRESRVVSRRHLPQRLDLENRT